MRRANTWLVVLYLGCGQPGPDRETNSYGKVVPVVAGPVVATVDGRSVTLADVNATSRATGLSPEDALRRIEEEELLSGYAERAGYGTDKKAEHDVEAARVRALLRTAVERGTAPFEIAESEVRERFESVRAAQEKPERRAVVHVVFRPGQSVTDLKAQRAAEALLAELKLMPREALNERLMALPSSGERDGVPFARELLSEVRQDGGLASEFVAAAFSTVEPQLLPQVVRTRFGFHVLSVKSIAPPVVVAFEDVQAAIREKLSIEKRTAALDALITVLRGRDKVTFNDEAIAKELAKDEILGSGP